MASVIIEEGDFTLKDGKSLYTKTWKPASGSAKARLVLLHGFSDHCNNYDIFSNTLAAQGISVHGYDQRGWGKSVTKPEERGRGGSTTVILDDLTQFIETLLADKDNPAPIFLKGHSMGGGIILTYAALAPATISPHIMGYILNAPLLLLGPASAPSAALRFILSVASRVLPNLQLPQKVDPEVVSRDPEVQKAFKEDKLAPGIGTPEGLWGMLERGRELMDGKVRVGVGKRVWIGHGTGDTLTSWEASRRWVEEVFSGGTDKEIRLFEGWRHKLHAEPGDDKITFANSVAEWILARVAPGAAAASSASAPADSGEQVVEGEDGKAKL